MNNNNLAIFMLNVQRDGNRTHTLLCDLFDKKVDIFMVQEPLLVSTGTTADGLSKESAKVWGFAKHQEWTAHHAPILDPLKPPRTVTYVRKYLDPVVTYRPDLVDHKDVVVVEIEEGEGSQFIVNVYNDGRMRDEGAVDALLNSKMDWHLESILMGGDFNLHHPQWALKGGPARAVPVKAHIFAEWLEACELHVLNDMEVATRPRSSSILDLVITSDPSIVRKMEVLEDAAGLFSDHRAIRMDVWMEDNRTQVEQNPEVKYNIETEKKKEWMSAFGRRVDTEWPRGIQSKEDIDEAARVLQDACTGATKEVMERKGRRKVFNAGWWTEECRDALDEYRFAPEHLRETYKWRWKYIIWKAKRDYFTKLLMERADEGITGVWKVASLCKGRPLRGVGALRTSDGSFATKPEQKAEVLRDAFFPSTPPLGPTQPAIRSSSASGANVDRVLSVRTGGGPQRNVQHFSGRNFGNRLSAYQVGS
jgi:hypothetical protein